MNCFIQLFMKPLKSITVLTCTNSLQQSVKFLILTEIKPGRRISFHFRYQSCSQYADHFHFLLCLSPCLEFCLNNTRLFVVPPTGSPIKGSAESKSIHQCSSPAGAFVTNTKAWVRVQAGFFAACLFSWLPAFVLGQEYSEVSFSKH